ncbi:MAG: cation:proton antiporter, partial [Ginsengibacter sp.]
FDMNISNGIIYTIKEQNITDILIGINTDPKQNNFPGPVTEDIVNKSFETVFLYECIQPFNTLKRMLVTVPANAELEPGFHYWLNRISTIAEAGGMSIHFFANELTMEELKNIFNQPDIHIEVNYKLLTDWEDFLIMTGELKPNDLFIIVSSRKGYISYSKPLEKIPYYLSKYFKQYSCLIIYPKQQSEYNIDDRERDRFLLDAFADKVQVVNKAGSYLSKIFKKKNQS